MDATNKPPTRSLTGQRVRSEPWERALKSAQCLKRLTLGTLPSHYAGATRRGVAIRSSLEGEVIATRGEIRLSDACLIDAAAGDELCLAICTKLLREKVHELTVDQTLNLLASMSRFRHSRNRQIALLELDREARDSILSFYSDHPQTLAEISPPLPAVPTPTVPPAAATTPPTTSEPSTTETFPNLSER